LPLTLPLRRRAIAAFACRFIAIALRAIFAADILLPPLLIRRLMLMLPPWLPAA